MLWLNLALDVTAITTSVIASIYSIGTAAISAWRRGRIRRLKSRLDDATAKLAERDKLIATLSETRRNMTVEHERANQREHQAAAGPRRTVPQSPPPARVPTMHVPHRTQIAPIIPIVPVEPAEPVSAVIGKSLEELTRAADSTGFMPAVLAGETPDEFAGEWDTKTWRPTVGQHREGGAA